MSRLHDRIVAEEKASRHRMADAQSFAKRLTVEERRRFYAWLDEIVENEANGAAAVAEGAAPANESGHAQTAEPPARRGPLVIVDGKKFDAAEAFVLASPRGASAVEVGKRIGQKGAIAAEALREIAQERGSIVQSKGKWYAAGKVPDRAATLGVVITDAIGVGEELGPSEIHERVLKRVSDAEKRSVSAEINRLVAAGVLEACGKDPHSNRGSLYRRTHGGAAAAR